MTLFFARLAIASAAVVSIGVQEADVEKEALRREEDTAARARISQGRHEALVEEQVGEAELNGGRDEGAGELASETPGNCTSNIVGSKKDLQAYFTRSRLDALDNMDKTEFFLNAYSTFKPLCIYEGETYKVTRLERPLKEGDKEISRFEVETLSHSRSASSKAQAARRKKIEQEFAPWHQWADEMDRQIANAEKIRKDKQQEAIGRPYGYGAQELVRPPLVALPWIPPEMRTRPRVTLPRKK